MKESRAIEVLCPAKVNLGLKVRARRPDGYHELHSLMLPIALYDRLSIRLEGEGVKIRCPGRPELDGPDNLAGRAARLWLAQGTSQLGVKILLRKRIPAAAGLGGGSSDAALVLLALNRLRPGLAQEQLAHLALQLGTDVPFFLKGAPCLAEGRGERLRIIEGLPPIWFVLATAPFGLATGAVFENLNFPLTSTRENDSYDPPQLGFAKLTTDLQNDLQPVAVRMRPSIGRVCDRLLEAGAHGVTMSGSGPSVVGLFPTRSEARQAIRRLVTDKGWKYQVVKGITSVLASRLHTT